MVAGKTFVVKFFNPDNAITLKKHALDENPNIQSVCVKTILSILDGLNPKQIGLLGGVIYSTSATHCQKS
jgi:hypothetical protein